MVAFPNAKINLGLFITSKRTDGYHNIESCFFPIPWKDTLEIIPSETFKITMYGLKIEGDTRNNLCFKAFELLKKDFDIPPVEIHLLKHIPMGAGLGGGSADGAFMIKMLNNHFDLNISGQKMEDYASKLGSDCPFFIKNKPALATQTGTTLKEINIDLSGYFIVVYNPNIHISTKEAYEGITPQQSINKIEEIVKLPVSEWKDLLINDFEQSIFPKYPKIATVKTEMYQNGALYASMTGSGSTVYGIFKEEKTIFEGSKCFKIE